MFDNELKYPSVTEISENNSEVFSCLRPSFMMHISIMHRKASTVLDELM